MAALQPRQVGQNTQFTPSAPFQSMATLTGRPTGPPSFVTFPPASTPTPISTTNTSPSTPTTAASASSLKSGDSVTSNSLSATLATAASTSASVDSAASLSAASASVSSLDGTPTTLASLPSSAASSVLTGSVEPQSITTAPASLSTSGSIPGVESQRSCSSLSCDPKLAAAIFVPIAVLLALLSICIAFFCIRRRGRSRLGQGLAFFSYGADTNHISPPRSSAGTDSREPSMREVESSLMPLAGGAAVGATVAGSHRHHQGYGFGRGLFSDQMTSRSSDDGYSLAPPPYAPRESTDAHATAVEPADVTRPSRASVQHAPENNTDPFADTANPFADDVADDVSLLSGDTVVNRGATGRPSVRDNMSIVSSLQDMDEAGSVREARMTSVSRGPSLATAPQAALNSVRSRSPRPRADS